MPVTFQLLKSELPALQGFLKLPKLPFGAKLSQVSEEAMLEAVTSLEKKKYLIRNENGTCTPDRTLALLLNVAARPYGSFTMTRHDDHRELLFFALDAIALFREDREAVEAIWLPFLPMAIGHVATVCEPYLNAFSGESRVCDSADLDEELERLQDQGFQEQWYCETQCTGAERQTCTVLSNDKVQVLLHQKGKVLTVSVPDKAAYVNTLTAMYAPIHGDAIKAGGLVNE